MSDFNKEVQSALSDIKLIKNIIQKNRSGLGIMSIKTSLVLQISALVISLVLLVGELISDMKISEFLLLTQKYTDLRLYTIGQIAILLFLCTIGIYFVVWRATNHNKKNFETDIEIDFKYIKNLSFLSDLMIKFSTISLLIMTGNGVWLTPFLLLCIGDYLIQGRLFIFKTRWSILLALFCFVVAFAQYWYHVYSLLIPIILFEIICISSIINLIGLKNGIKNLNFK